MKNLDTRGRAWAALSPPPGIRDVLLVAFSVIAVVPYYATNRPLWIDEVCQFALAGMDAGEALRAIYDTTGGGVNFGQTGAYYFLDYLIPSVAGANLLAIRFPSALAAVVMLLSAALFLRLQGYSRWWQALVMVAILAQSSLMYFAGEARAYLPMASFTVAALAYYRLPLRRRHGLLGRALGIYALVLGSVFHPYFSLLTGAVIVFSLWHAYWRDDLRMSVRTVVRFANPALLVPAAMLYLAVAFATWLKGSGSLHPDPFEYVGSAMGLVRTILGTHFNFLYLPLETNFTILPASLDYLTPEKVPVLIVIVGITTLPLLRTARRTMTPPAVLMWVGIATTACLATISYWQHYWIIQRQWLAGIALVSVATIWALAAFSTATIDRRARLLLVPLMVAVIGLASVQALKAQLGVLDEYTAAWDTYRADSRTPQEVLAQTRDNAGWEYLANLNVSRGTKPWRELAAFYGVTESTQ